MLSLSLSVSLSLAFHFLQLPRKSTFEGNRQWKMCFSIQYNRRHRVMSGGAVMSKEYSPAQFRPCIRWWCQIMRERKQKSRKKERERIGKSKNAVAMPKSRRRVGTRYIKKKSKSPEKGSKV
jgi:hypothetical protein